MTPIRFEEFDESRPIYLQIMESIQKAIARGELKPGDKMPSVRELARELRVNPNTVQRAYQELEREGITFTKRGQGNFVTEDTEKIKAVKEELLKKIVEKFLKELNSIGVDHDKIMEILKEMIENEGDRG